MKSIFKSKTAALSFITTVAGAAYRIPFLALDQEEKGEVT